ncbi:uncharacterized protein LOC120825135 [Gasterosteus aculeatus]
MIKTQGPLSVGVAVRTLHPNLHFLVRKASSVVRLETVSLEWVGGRWGPRNPILLTHLMGTCGSWAAHSAIGSLEDDKESRVNIYVSAESLRVYDNPWMEATSPNTPPAEAQHPAIVEKVEKRNPIRTESVFLGLLCLLLLAVIICLWVQMNKDKTLWRRERNQFAADNTNLREINAKLTADNAELTEALLTSRESFADPGPRKYKHLDDS